MPIGAIPAWLGAVMAGGSVASGILGNRKSARTTESASKTASSSVNRSRRVLRPEQEGLVGPVSGYANRLLTDPAAGLEPIRAGMRNTVNSSFSGVDAGLRDKMLASGGSASGKYGKAVLGADLARRGALAGVDTDVAQMILQQQNQGASLAERLLSVPFEQEVSGSNTGTMAGTGTLPGSMLAGGMNSGLDAITTLFMLDKMLKGGG